MRPIIKRLASILCGGLLLSPISAVGSHLFPVLPVLPGQNHQHEDHSGSDFSAVDLRNVDFSFADLSESMFQQAQIDGASFIGANLDRSMLRTSFINGGADFTSASLVGATMNGMEGTRVIFCDADLSGVNLDDSFFTFSDFRNASFLGADIGEFAAHDSDFRGADLSTAINIDTLFERNLYDATTRFPDGYDPEAGGFILVPEPGSMSLLALGLGALLQRRRKFNPDTRKKFPWQLKPDDARKLTHAFNRSA